MKSRDIYFASKGITDVLNDFLKPFDCVAYLGTDFCYHTATNSISIALFVTEEADRSFNDFIKTEFPKIDASLFIWSFLHELGHHETEDDFEDEEFDEYMRRTSSKDITNEEYYHLPIEYAATRWAGDYIQSHADEIARLNQDVTAAMYKFLEAVDYAED